MAYRLWRPESFLDFITFLKAEWSLDISVVQANEQAKGWKIWSLNPDSGSYFLFSTTANSGAGAHSTQPPVSWHRCSFAEVKQPGVNLATQLFLYREWERKELYLYVWIRNQLDVTFVLFFISPL